MIKSLNKDNKYGQRINKNKNRILKIHFLKYTNLNIINKSNNKKEGKFNNQNKSKRKDYSLFKKGYNLQIKLNKIINQK